MKNIFFLVYILINKVFSYNFPNNIVSCGISHCDIDNLDACTYSCNICNGYGVLLCPFCHGTGFFTVGDSLMKGATPCPICNGSGEKECNACKGAGKIANWRKEYNKQVSFKKLKN